jgi:hypothetical protein
MIKEEESQQNNNDLINLKPWNSNEFPVKINNIKYNQDNSLFTLATSKGYKIFSTKNLRQVHEETEKVRELGDLESVQTYYSTSLVFILPTKNNEKYTKNELILFDDYSQKITFKFKSKKETINFFYVGKYAICIALQNQMIILELITLKIVYIISNIYIDEKLCSFNTYGFIAYTQKNEKYNVYIKILNTKNNKIISIRNKILKPNFEYLQALQLSPSGQFVALCSLFGNKVHIYYVENLILKECLYLGDEINDIHKISFASKGEYFLLVQLNQKKMKLYELSNIIEGQFKCKCYNYKNEEMIKEVIKKKEDEHGWFNYFKNMLYLGYNNQPVEEKIIDTGFVCVSSGEDILFTDFVENEFIYNKKDLDVKEVVIINGKGHYYKYLFNNERNKLDDNINNNFELMESVQWV